MVNTEKDVGTGFRTLSCEILQDFGHYLVRSYKILNKIFQGFNNIILKDFPVIIYILLYCKFNCFRITTISLIFLLSIIILTA